MTTNCGNGDGSAGSLHKRTILKGVVPRLESSEYFLVYRPSLETF